MTKYDPAHRDERGHYIGSEDTDSDHGPVEAAYLDAVAAFAEDTGVDCLQIREPSAAPGVGLDTHAPAEALVGLFGAELDGYHDGAQVRLDHALELVRLMLGGDGGWCRLEAGEDFFIHVGWDQYVYVGSSVDCRRAVSFTRERGLFAEPIPGSPYDPEATEDDTDVRPADAAFWAELTELVERHGAALLEEGYLHNASRWHRLTTSTVATIRDKLTPRARLLVWPDLSTDVPAVLYSLPDEGLVEVVWQDRAGRITSHLIDESDQPALRARLADAHAATALSAYADERRPLLAAVLPDPDGVLRARWSP
ncbi:hypothetical protein [Micromonospora sp. NPDC050200]|uniref:hypothetical protein n=1 Tax=Micromonospora sp. NPDC050200 TaxID=3155664 RepID=UPI0033FB1270